MGQAAAAQCEICWAVIAPACPGTACSACGERQLTVANHPNIIMIRMGPCAWDIASCAQAEPLPGHASLLNRLGSVLSSSAGYMLHLIWAGSRGHGTSLMALYLQEYLDGPEGEGVVYVNTEEGDDFGALLLRNCLGETSRYLDSLKTSNIQGNR